MSGFIENRSNPKKKLNIYIANYQSKQRKNMEHNVCQNRMICTKVVYLKSHDTDDDKSSNSRIGN